jgi:hypothetical protein
MLLMKQLHYLLIFRQELLETHRYTYKKKITRTVDPNGSYYVESLTHEIAQNAWKLIEEVQELWND